MNDSKKWAIFYKKEKENMAEINESLMKNIEFLETENVSISNYFSSKSLQLIKSCRQIIRRRNCH